MKHSILPLALVTLVTISCSPLRIAMNTSTPDGKRTVLTSDQSLFNTSGGHLTIALGTRISGKDTIMGVLITCSANTGHGVFDKEDRLMLRLSDNSEIILKNLYDKEFENIEETTVTDQYKTEYGAAYSYDPWMDAIYVTPYEVTRVVPQVHHYKTTNSYALYLITKKEIQDIISKGVVKLRVEIEDRDLDMKNTDGVSALFANLRECLMGGIAAGTQRTEF